MSRHQQHDGNTGAPGQIWKSSNISHHNDQELYVDDDNETAHISYQQGFPIDQQQYYEPDHEYISPPPNSVSVSGGTAHYSPIRKPAMVRESSVSRSRKYADGYGDYDRPAYHDNQYDGHETFNPDTALQPSVRDLQRENRLAHFLTDKENNNTTYDEEFIVPHVETTPYVEPMPEPEPLPAILFHEPVKPVESQYHAYSTYSSDCFTNGRMTILVAVLVGLSWVFSFASFFGPWTISKRIETGASGIVAWRYTWTYDYHLAYYASSATSQDINYRDASDWRSQCHHDGTWAAILFNALNLVVLIALFILVILAYTKDSRAMFTVSLILVWVVFVFYFLSLGFWLLGCHDVVKSNTIDALSTDASVITNDTNVAWGWGFVLMCWLLILIAGIIITYVWIRDKNSVSSVRYATNANYGQNNNNQLPYQQSKQLDYNPNGGLDDTMNIGYREGNNSLYNMYQQQQVHQGIEMTSMPAPQQQQYQYQPEQRDLNHSYIMNDSMQRGQTVYIPDVHDRRNSFSHNSQQQAMYRFSEPNTPRSRVQPPQSDGQAVYNYPTTPSRNTGHGAVDYDLDVQMELHRQLQGIQSGQAHDNY